MAAFGWAVGRCDGHDPLLYRPRLRGCEREPGRAEAARCGHAQGRRRASWSRALPVVTALRLPLRRAWASVRAGVEELVDRIDKSLARLGAGASAGRAEPRRRRAALESPQRLIDAYGGARRRAEREPSSSPSTATCCSTPGWSRSGALPGAFFECGIAEQDLVSQAGAMALPACCRSATPSRAFCRRGRPSRSSTTRARGRRSSTTARSPGSFPAARALAPVGARHRA